MKKHIRKIIYVLIAVLLLAAAFFFGSGSPGKNARDIEKTKVSDSAVKKSASDDKESQPNDDLTESNQTEDDAPQTEEHVNEKNESVPPVQKETASEKSTADDELTCSISIRCDTILNNISNLNKDKVDFVPKDGVILSLRTVSFSDGESVFDVLMRETKKNKIHIEFENTPMYNSAYIEGIGNLYEFDCGELSGWMYRVNGEFPNYGCSKYKLKKGDKIEWLYTCDLGADVGGSFSENGR